MAFNRFSIYLFIPFFYFSNYLDTENNELCTIGTQIKII